jgi:hypothetical protein
VVCERSAVIYAFVADDGKSVDPDVDTITFISLACQG